MALLSSRKRHVLSFFREWRPLVMVVATSFMLAGCSIQPKFHIEDPDNLVDTSFKANILEMMTKAGTLHGLSIAFVAFQCGADKTVAFTVDGKADIVFDKFEKELLEQSAVILFCPDKRLLTTRYSGRNFLQATYGNPALPSAFRSGLITGTRVSGIQQLALQDPHKAIEAQLEEISKNYHPHAWYAIWQSIGNGAIYVVHKDFSIEKDSWLLNATILNALHILTAPASVGSGVLGAVGLFVVILITGYVMRLAFDMAITFICLPLAFVSAAMARVMLMCLRLAVVLFWSLPVLGALNMIGGATLEQEWLLIELLGDGFRKIIDAIQYANASIGNFSTFTMVIFVAVMAVLSGISQALMYGTFASLSGDKEDVAGAMAAGGMIARGAK